MAELERVELPDGRWEVCVSERMEAVLLNKLAHKTGEIRWVMEQLREALDDFERLFAAGGTAETAGVTAHSGALSALHRDFMQVLDIARQTEVPYALVVLATGKKLPTFRLGVRE